MAVKKKLLLGLTTALVASSLGTATTLATSNAVHWKNDQGTELKDNWLHKYGHEYYFKENGDRATNETVKIDGEYYHFDKDGVMLKDQFYTDKDGNVYYFDKTGVMYQDKFYKNWGNTYYFGKDGKRYTHQWYSNWGHDYYFGDNGVLYTNTTAKIDGNIYYFNKDGIEAKNQNITFQGVTYHADDKGVLTPIQTVYQFDPSKINHTYDLSANEGDSRLASHAYIILHEVGAESGAAANANYLKNNWYNANTTFVVGDGGQVFEVSEPGYVSWGALSANPYAPIQIELGRTYSRDQFIQDYQTYVSVARYYANAYGIPTSLDQGGAGTHGIKSHKWVSDNIEGDHQDPYGYLGSWGISKDQLAHDLQYGIDLDQLQQTVYQQRQ